MEFLIGRTLSNALLSLGIYEDVKTALAGMGLDLEELIDEENDPGTGNGGLGRLAACFLDSTATLGLPGTRLRHPLRLRHVQAKHHRRPADGVTGLLAGVR